MSALAKATVSIVIPTFNRKDALREVLKSALAQTVPVELVVMDDGSTDGTGEMVRTEFPQAIYKNFPGPNGPAFLRNRGAELAHGEYLFPVDDDAVFISPQTIEQTLRDFNHPRIAAVGIPYINVRINMTVRQHAHSAEEIEVVEAFVGASHAVRRDEFLAVGGYRPELFYMGEEGDLCLRMLSRGYITRLGRADPMHHFESPARSTWRADMYGRRNDILFGWQNVPLALVPLHWARSSAGGMIHGFRTRRPWRMFRGLLWGFGSAARYISTRAPVNRQVYHLYRRLKHGGGVRLSEIEPVLPAMKPRAAGGVCR